MFELIIIVCIIGLALIAGLAFMFVAPFVCVGIYLYDLAEGKDEENRWKLLGYAVIFAAFLTFCFG